MDVLCYEFETIEDREMALNNIVKWHGSSIAERVDSCELSVQAPSHIAEEMTQIIEKHFGRLKSGN